MSFSILRPNATTTNTGALFGGASAHAILSDDSDASYVELEPTELFRVALADLSLPAAAVIYSMAVRMRVARVGSAYSSFSLTTGITGLSGSLNINNATPQTYSVAYLASSTLTDAQADAAYIEITNTYPVSTADVLAYEAYLDVTYVTQPVVTVTAPTGTLTTTNLPTVTWTNSIDSVGGDQAFSQVRVFTDTQYLAGGFDPATSTATVDSGLRAGNGRTWVSTASLPDGTYRAYVRAGQLVNGVTHWSAYAFSGFVISVALPAVPTFTATADSANARITLALADAGGSASTDVFEVQRSLDAGVTWATVRQLTAGYLVNTPAVVATGVFSDTVDATTHNAVLPAPTGGILANDLLIAVVAMDGTPTVAWPTDWTEIKDEAGNGSAVRVACAWKRAVGGETGTIAVATSVAEGGAIRILCVRGAHTTTAPEVSTGTNGSLLNSADPDSLNPAGWGTEHTLWIAAMGIDGNVAVTAAPSGYYEFGYTQWANVSGSGVATAFRQFTAASEDPGVFTHAAEDVRAFTIAVRPAVSSLVVYDYEASNGVSASYRARALHNYGGYAATAWSATQSATWTSTSWWFKHPNRPALNVTVLVHSLETVSRASRRGVFQPLGAAAAIVVSDTRGPITGTVVLRSDTAAAQIDLDELLNEAAILMLQSPVGQGGPDYISVGNHDRSRVRQLRSPLPVFEALDFTAVAQPTGDVVAWPP